MNDQAGRFLETPEELQRFEGLIEGLFQLLRTSRSHGTGHPMLRQVSQQFCERVDAMSPPFAIQFVGGVVFLNRTLVPLTPKVYPMSVSTAQSLAHAAIQEVTFHRSIRPDEALAWAAEIVRGNRQRGVLPQLELPNMEWRTIEGAVHGAELEHVDPEVFAASQLALAVGEVEMLMMGTSEAWDFPKGVSAVRRIERCLASGSQPIARALEIAPGQWTTARRAVAACIHLVGTALVLEVAPRSYRAAAHALLAITCSGYQPREGLPFAEALSAAHAYVVKPAGDTKSQAEPHRVRTCALLNAALASLARGDHRDQELGPKEAPGSGGFAQETGEAGDVLVKFLRFCYDLERLRCPKNLGYELGLTDILATTGPEAIKQGLGGLYKALLSAYGQIPPGSRVVLGDGRLGMVLEPNDVDPLLPVVLVGDRVEKATQPVILVSPSLLHLCDAPGCESR